MARIREDKNPTNHAHRLGLSYPEEDDVIDETNYRTIEAKKHEQPRPSKTQGRATQETQGRATQETQGFTTQETLGRTTQETVGRATQET